MGRRGPSKPTTQGFSLHSSNQNRVRTFHTLAQYKPCCRILRSAVWRYLATSRILKKSGTYLFDHRTASYITESYQHKTWRFRAKILRGHGLKRVFCVRTISLNSASPSHEWTPLRAICLWQFLHQWAPHPTGQSRTLAALKSSASRGVLTLHLKAPG